MTEIEYSRGDEADALCRTCGLCCSGHLFSWVQIKAVEIAHLQKLGLTVIQPVKNKSGFTQPCPMWDGECSIYQSENYPSGCRSFNCKLLREVLNESISLSRALRIVKRTKEKIGVVEKLLPSSSQVNFRERVVEYLSHLDRSTELTVAERELQTQLGDVLNEIKNQFGVRNFESTPDTGQV